MTTNEPCMPAPAGREAASTCSLCGAVATYHAKDSQGRPVEPANLVTPSASCRCRCHDTWRWMHGVQLDSRVPA